jgi:hypothetical protein
MAQSSTIYFKVPCLAAGEQERFPVSLDAIPHGLLSGANELLRPSQ